MSHLIYKAVNKFSTVKYIFNRKYLDIFRVLSLEPSRCLRETGNVLLGGS